VLLDDVAVPLTRIAALCQEVARIAECESLTIGTFGHLGDGNLHPTIVYDRTDEDSVRRCQTAFEGIMAAALALGGTITGEHGVGTLKAGFLESEVGPVALTVHRAVKFALDPYCILNPGTILTNQCRESP
jgi:glycolate oxidase